jgi:nicotinamide-nucleotide amidase
VKRLGCLVIGDEILAGHVHESNSHWLARELRAMGIKLTRVEVCTDALGDIESSVQRFLHDLAVDYVITSGGLGPTPDDRTMEGIARALGTPLVMEDGWRDWMRERVREGHRRGYFDSPEPNAGLWKMARLPQGATAMPNRIGTALGAIIEAHGRTLFTLPGVPAEFRRMFHEGVAPLLEQGEPEHVVELILYAEESRFHDLLADLEQQYPEVTLGSYPQVGHITIRAAGPRDRAEAVMAVVREAGKNFT